MKQPSLKSRKEYADIVNDSATIVPIRGTKKKVKLHWIKPYTMERLTDLWIERDMASADVSEGSQVLKDLAKEPYFAFKEAALMVLNNDIKIRLFYPFLWRWWAFRFDESQMVDIVAEGKKKLPLSAHFEIMVYSLDMRTDMMRMTKKEAEQYQAERDLAVKRLSAKSSPGTANPVGDLVGGSGISATDVS